MPDLLPVTLDEQIAEVERELEMRSRVYPELKRNAGLLKRNAMDRQWDRMEAVLKTLKELRDGGCTDRAVAE